MLAWFALLVRDLARAVAPFPEISRGTPRLAPARAHLPRRITARAPRRRMIEH